jgi:hypothetical protein
VYLQVLGYCFNALPDTVADDQQEEAPAPEVCGECIVELSFVDMRINRPHHLKKRVAVALKTPAHLPLQIGRRLATEFFGVVENLANYLAPPLGVAPKLAFNKHRQSRWRNHEIVNRASGRV